MRGGGVRGVINYVKRGRNSDLNEDIKSLLNLPTQKSPRDLGKSDYGGMLKVKSLTGFQNLSFKLLHYVLAKFLVFVVVKKAIILSSLHAS